MIKFSKFKIIPCLFSVLFGVCLVFLPLASKASTLYFLPQAQDIYSGDTFIVNADIDTESDTVNAIEGNILFPAEKLEVVDIIKGESIIGLWIKEPVYFRKEGKIIFSGGIPNGFRGQGTVLKIVFRATDGSDSADIRFERESRVLLNDGKGTAATLDFLAGNYKISEKEKNLPVISSPTHPDSSKWYRQNSLELHWDLISDAEYSYILSKDASADPDEIADKPEGDLVWMGDLAYKGLDDGIYYFHLKQKISGGLWSKKATFRIMIDNNPPEYFSPKIAEIEGKKYLVFDAKDAVSGIDYYEIIETEQNIIPKDFLAKNNKWEKAANPYLIKYQNLNNEIKLKAVDKAGNERIVEIISSKKSIPYAFIVLIIGVAIIIIKSLRIFKRK